MGMRTRIWHTDNWHRDLPHRLLQGARPGRGQQRTRPRHISPSGSFKPSWRCKEARTMLLIVTPSGAPYTVHETFANDQELEDSMAQAGRTHRRSPTPAGNTRDDLARWTRTSNSRLAATASGVLPRKPVECLRLRQSLGSFYYLR